MKLRLLLISVLLSFGAGVRAADFPGTVVLGRATNQSVAANLLAPANLTVYLEYGTRTGTYGTEIPPVSLSANVPQEVTLGGLTANTRYYYRLRFRTATATSYDASPESSFMTQRSAGSTFTFGVQGDSHPERVGVMFNSAYYTRTLQTVAADNSDFYILLGDDFSIDTINQANPRAVTQPQVIDRYIMQRPYLGLIGKAMPVYLVNGNHEQAARYLLDGTPNNVAVWAQNARNAYYAQPAPDDFYSGNPEQIPHIGLLRNFFAWTWGDALFVTLDPYWGSPVVADNDFYGGAKTTDQWKITHGELQYQWLKTTLEGSKAKYKFVFAHHVLGTGRGGVDIALKYEWGGQNANGTPGFAQNRPTWALPIHQLMAANKVTIFFQGHDHIFVRQQLDGVTYQSLGNPADPNYSLFNSDAFATGERFPNSGYARVTVAPSGVKVEYVRTYPTTDEGPGKVNGTVAFSYVTASAAEQTPIPVITAQPRALAVARGSAVAFSVSASSALPMSYQWKRNGVEIAGATTAVLGITAAQAADAGSYTVVVATSAGSVISTPALLTLGASRLVNMSVRSTAGTGSDTLIVGCVVGEGFPLAILLRGIGPALTGFGVTGVLPDPVLTLSDSAGGTVASNDNWTTGGNSNETAAVITRVGAFALPNGALDSALVANLTPGAYTATVSGKNAATGIALMEAYDAATTTSAAHLVNMSARTLVGTGGSILIAGFAVQGDVTKQLLIRAIGPSLTQFGVTGVLADPQLALFRAGETTPLQQNDNWLSATNSAQVSLASAQVGAFGLPAVAKDSAMLVTLAPGSYTAQVSGVGGTTGVALVEIYEVP